MSHEADFRELTRAVEHDEQGAACKLMNEFSGANIQDAIRALNTIQKTNREDRIDAIKNGQPDLPEISVSNKTQIDQDGTAHLKLGLSVPKKFDYQRDFNLKDGSSTGIGSGPIIVSCGVRAWPKASDQEQIKNK